MLSLARLRLFNNVIKSNNIKTVSSKYVNFIRSFSTITSVEAVQQDVDTEKPLRKSLLENAEKIDIRPYITLLSEKKDIIELEHSLQAKDYFDKTIEKIKDKPMIEQYRYYILSMSHLSNDVKLAAITSLVKQDSRYIGFMSLFHSLNENYQEATKLITESNTIETNNDIYITILAGAMNNTNIDNFLKILTQFEKYQKKVAGVTDNTEIYKQVERSLMQIFQWDTLPLVKFIMEALHTTKSWEKQKYKPMIKNLFPHSTFLEGLYRSLLSSPRTTVMWAEAMVRAGYHMDEDIYLDIQTVLLALNYSSSVLNFRYIMSNYEYFPTSRINSLFLEEFIQTGETENIKENFLKITENSSAPVLSQKVYDSMVNLLLREIPSLDDAGKLKNLRRVSDIQEKHPSTGIYNSLMNYYIRNVEKAFEIFSQLINHPNGLQPDDVTLKLLKTLLGNRYKEVGLLEYLIETLPNNNSETYLNLILKISIDKGDFASSVEYFTKIVNNKYTIKENIVPRMVTKFSYIEPSYWKQLFREDIGLEFNSVSYHSLIWSQSHSEIQHTLSLLKSNGIPLELDTIKLLVDGTLNGSMPVHSVQQLIQEELSGDDPKKMEMLGYVLSKYPYLPFTKPQIKEYSTRMANQLPSLIQISLANGHLDMAWEFLRQYQQSPFAKESVLIESKSNYLYASFLNMEFGALDNIHLKDYINLEIRMAVFQGIYDACKYRKRSKLTKDVLLNIERKFQDTNLTVTEHVLIKMSYICQGLLTDTVLDQFYDTHKLSIANLQFIAKHFILNNNTNLAVKWLNKLLSQSPTTAQLSELIVTLKCNYNEELSFILCKYLAKCPSDSMYGNEWFLMSKYYLSKQDISNFITSVLKIEAPLDQCEILDIFGTMYINDIDALYTQLEIYENQCENQIQFDQFVAKLAVHWPTLVKSLPEYLSLVSKKFRITKSLNDSLVLALSHSKSFDLESLYISLGIHSETPGFLSILRQNANADKLFSQFLPASISKLSTQKSFTEDLKSVYLIASENPRPNLFRTLLLGSQNTGQISNSALSQYCDIFTSCGMAPINHFGDNQYLKSKIYSNLYPLKTVQAKTEFIQQFPSEIDFDLPELEKSKELSVKFKLRKVQFQNLIK
ncbi:phosphatidylinositol glycan [Tieghemostelium lacteum]|uniref:Phosphatidylinositol glycan n=1 Tax=Tieghemostelium lacteum TaxID=361077 RepID=A0A152A1S2_TIELA|nr:phosphatidylinositol glycan [Tieghemostelium lacteum]|eukprot:KYR00176.1 phosphatidylinositol glycan [Tieghemostelium lacteum]